MAGLILPRDTDDLERSVLKPEPKGVWFICPVCRNRYRTDITGLEPVCTGPSLVRDEHPHTPMVRVQ